MHPDLEKLIALQQADAEVARLREEIAALPRRVAVIEAQLAGTRAEIEKAQQALAATQAARRKLETEIQDHREKISKYRDQSLAVKTNEQYKALLHEIEFTERHIRAAEDKILEGMVDSDAREATLKAAEAELREETAEIEREKAEARARTAEDEKLLAEQNGRRDAWRGSITPDVLQHYDRVLHLRKIAVAEARAQTCLLCNVLLRPQTYNEVRSNEQIMTCDSCGRILYYDPAHQAAEADRQNKRAKAGFTVEKAWYYIPDWKGQEVFVAYVNHLGSSSHRVWDVATGTLIDKQVVEDSTFKEAFRIEIESGRKVHVDAQPNLEEECNPVLPGKVLDELRAQVPSLQAAQEQINTEAHH